MAPLKGSPVINQGSSPGVVVLFDQRGLSRVYADPIVAKASNGNGSDLGAVELNPATVTVTTTTDPDYNPTMLSLRQAIELTGGILSRVAERTCTASAASNHPQLERVGGG